LQISRLTECFEGLNSSLAQSTDKLWSCKHLANMGKLQGPGQYGQIMPFKAKLGWLQMC